MRSRQYAISAISLALLSGQLHAGEVSGLPPGLAPTIRPDYTYFLGNDFAASGTSDDFRTGQMMVTGRFADAWLAVVDHSIFTREDGGGDQRGRVDTMTWSLGYELFRIDQPGRRSSLFAGAAIRSVGNFGGARIQNGFHRLIESDTDAIPYTDTRQSDPAAWFLGQHFQRLRAATDTGFMRRWDLGYWARLGGLATTDGQIDGIAGLYAVASRGHSDVWLGLRRDWRSGYDADFVLREAAAEEDKLAVSLGARFGSLVIETVQRIESSASFGQLSFVSSPETRGEIRPAEPRMDFQAALHVPHITFQLATRWRKRLLTQVESTLDEALMIEVRGGQPQLGNDPTLFVDTAQASVALEWSRAITSRNGLRLYVSAGGGWRREQLLGREQLRGERSRAVDRAVLVADTGLEVDAIRLSNRTRLSLRLGAAVWLPLSDAAVDIGDTSETLQEPGASITFGWVVRLNE